MIIKHKLRLIFTLFSLLTITSSIYGLYKGNEFASHAHILSRFVITFFAIGSLYLFDWLKGMKLYKIHILHYGITTLMIMGGLWIYGNFGELHPDAYRDLFLNYTVVYLGVTGIELFYFRLVKKNFKTKKRQEIMRA